MVYLLLSDEQFFIEQEIKKIKVDNNIEDIDINEYNLDEINIKDILEDCSTYSLFNDKKIVIVKNSYLFTSKKCLDNDIELLENYLNNINPSTILIFILNDKIDERKKITKLIKKIGIVKEFDTTNIKSIVKDLFNPYVIDNDLINLFIDRVGNNLLIINSEIDKIKIYKGDNKVITKDDIISLTSENIEANIFLLIDYIINKDKNKAITIYNKLIDLNEEPIAIIITLANKIRLLYQTKELYKKGYKETDISTILNVKPGYLYYLKNSLNKYDSNTLYNILSSLADLDYEIKVGNIDKKQALELFILNN